MPKVDLEDVPVLTQDQLSNPKLIAPVGDYNKPEGARKYGFRIVDVIAAAIAKFILEKEVIPFVELDSNIWNVIQSPRVVIDLETDANAYVTQGAKNGRYFEAYVKQPLKGGQSFFIDDQRIKINTKGNTLVVARYVKGYLDVHTDASATANKPQLISQSGDLTVLQGDIVAISALFDDGDDFKVYKNTRLVEGSSGSGLTFFADEPASYEFEAINAYGRTRSLPISVKIGVAAPPKIVTAPVSVEVNAGGTLLINPNVSGVPSPIVVLQKKTGVDADNKDVFEDSVTIPSGGYSLSVINTETYRLKATNQLPNEDAVDVFSAPFVVTAKKQVQVAPTAPVVNSTNHTLDFTYASGVTSPSLYELTINGGTSYTDFTQKPVPVPDQDFAKNTVGVRVKETATRNASATLYNDVIFAGTPLEQPFESSIANVEIDNIVDTGSGSNHVYKQGPVSRSNTGDFTNDMVQTNRSFPANTPFYIEMEAQSGLSEGSFGLITPEKLAEILQNPQLGNIRAQVVGIMLAGNTLQKGVHKNNYSAVENGVGGPALVGDLIRLERREKQSGDSNMPWYFRNLRNGADIPDIKLDYVNDGELIPHIAITENGDAGIKNPKTYNSKPRS